MFVRTGMKARQTEMRNFKESPETGTDLGLAEGSIPALTLPLSKPNKAIYNQDNILQNITSLGIVKVM